MAVTASFDELLTEKLHPELLKNEVVNRCDILKKIELDNSWKGGTYAIGFREASASSVLFNGYTAEADIAEGVYKRGSISAPKTLTGSLKFNHKDLINHDTNKITEASFLKILPGVIDDFADTLRMVLAQSLLNGKVLARGKATGTAGGVMQVDRIERFRVGMKIEMEDADTGLTAYYVIAIDKSSLAAPTITLSLTRGGAATTLVAFTTASTGINIYHPGAKADGFLSFKDILAPATTTLWGLAKASYSYLQPSVISGSDMTASNIVDKIFGYVLENQIVNGSKNEEVWMSGRKFGNVLSKLQSTVGGFNIVPGSRKISQYGFQEVQIGSITGQLITLVAVPEMDDEVMMIVNPKDFKFASNGFIRQAVSPEGNKFYTVRSATGYVYVCDYEVFGELVCTAPAKQMFINAIPSPLA